jgi:hypothetical protein
MGVRGIAANVNTVENIKREDSTWETLIVRENYTKSLVLRAN